MQPQGITTNPAGTILYVGDTRNNRIRAISVNPPTLATLSTELSFVVNHNDKFAIQMWGPTTTTTSWGGSMLLEKAAMVQGGGRTVRISPIRKIPKRKSSRNYTKRCAKKNA
jgi:DNA-binding beta-propeller fold protein YncE